MAMPNEITFKLGTRETNDLCVAVGAATRSDDPKIREIAMRVRDRLIDAGILPPERSAFVTTPGGIPVSRQFLEQNGIDTTGMLEPQ